MNDYDTDGDYRYVVTRQEEIDEREAFYAMVMESAHRLIHWAVTAIVIAVCAIGLAVCAVVLALFPDLPQQIYEAADAAWRALFA